MSSIQPCKAPQGKVQRCSVKNFQSVLEKFHNLTTSSRSVTCKLKVLQSKAGGNLVITSTSQRLFQSLTVRKPVLQLLVSAAQGHLEAYNDGGMFVISLASGLVLGALKSEINCTVLAEIFETFLSIVCDFINCDTCIIRFPALLSNISFMSSYVKSIIRPKCMCGLDEAQISYISNLLLQVFLNNISEKGEVSVKESVFVLTQEGFNVTESKVYEGLLVEAPDLSRFKLTGLKLRRALEGDKNGIKVAMVAVSLSGDMEELSNVKYEVFEDIDVEEEVLEKLTVFSESLIRCNVGLLLCQKVVHPLIKRQLRDAGILVVDRMGLNLVKYVTKLTGATTIQCLDEDIPHKYYGWVDNAQHVIVNKRSFLQLTKGDNQVCTLVLCQVQDQQLEELKVVCESSLQGLEKLLFQSSVLPGGGCWQVLFAQYLTEQIRLNVVQMSTELECTRHQLLKACDIFNQVLLTATLCDPSNYLQNLRTGHVHKQTGSRGSCETEDINELCQCGMYANKPEDPYQGFSHSNDSGTKLQSKSTLFDCKDLSDVEKRTMLQDVLCLRDLVFDGTGMCVNALQTGVLAACSLLRIGQIMENL